MSACKGVFNEVRGIDEGLLKSNHVHAKRMKSDGVSDETYNTGKTIKQLMAERKLFVCDESGVVTKSTASWGDNRVDPRLLGMGQGGGANEINQENPNVAILVQNAVKL